MEGHWHESLASRGESSVEQKVDDHDRYMKELQQQGKEKAEDVKIRLLHRMHIWRALQICLNFADGWTHPGP